jgi:prolyl oligopeptidase
MRDMGSTFQIRASRFDTRDLWACGGGTKFTPLASRARVRAMRRSSYLCFGLLLGVVLSATAAPRFQYPETKRTDVVDDYFGTKVPDPYRWLEDADSPETAAWVEAQDKLTFSYLEALPDRKSFKQRLTELTNFERYTLPKWEGGRYVYSKNDGLQNQSVLYTLKKLDDEPVVLLDPNKMSPDGTVAVFDPKVSNDGNLVAYNVSVSGSDWREIRVLDIERGQDLADVVKWNKFSAPEWTKDSKGFFYCRFPAPEDSKDPTFAKLNNQKLYYHRLGDPEEEDILIMERPQESDIEFTGIVSHDGRYLFVETERGTEPKNLLAFKDLQDPQAPKLDAEFTLIVDQMEADYRVIGAVGNQLFVRTDANAPKYKIIAIDLNRPSRNHWREIIPESKNLLANAELAGGKLVVNYVVDATNQLFVFSLDGKAEKKIPLATIGSVTALSGDPDRSEFFYSFTSFLYPSTIYQYDIGSGTNFALKKPQVPFDADAFETKQIFYHSKDGTQIPMFIVHKKDLKLDGNNPVFLTGYGGFNVSILPNFNPSIVAWIEKGGVYALPNLRGGGEYGREWHEAGVLEKKQNVFDDFIAAAKTLIGKKYTTRGKVGINGGSNGGLLIGAVMTQKPDLFGAAVPQVGVLDMLRYHKFTIGSQWRSDYGVSDTKDGFNYLFKYSPLHNIQKGTCYPPTLILTGDHDDRVVPGHSFKFGATLQAAQGCDNPVLLRIDTRTGHGAGKPVTKWIDEEADIAAFMWDTMNGSAVHSGGSQTAPAFQ